MEVKNTRAPFSEEEMNKLKMRIALCGEFRILVRFMMKQTDGNLCSLRQTLTYLSMPHVRRASEKCSEAFIELNQ